MPKPFKGELLNWKKRPVVPGMFREDNLGYHIVAIPKGHPEFVDWIITSPVVSHNEETGECETLNSLYTTVGPCKGTLTGKLSKSDFQIDATE